MIFRWRRGTESPQARAMDEVGAAGHSECDKSRSDAQRSFNDRKTDQEMPFTKRRMVNDFNFQKRVHSTEQKTDDQSRYREDGAEEEVASEVTCFSKKLYNHREEQQQ